MINISLIVDHIKARLGVTHRHIEFSDESIIKCIQDTTLKTISVYAPYYLIAFLNLKDNQVLPGMNTFFIPTEYGDQFELMSVEYLLPTSVAASNYNDASKENNTTPTSNTAFTNALSYTFLPGGGDLQATIASLSTMKLGMSMYNATTNPCTFDFLPPNMIRINSAGLFHNVAMVVRTTHKKDFTTFPAGMLELVKDMAFYDVCIDIYSIRKYFSSIRTLFAEIQLDMDMYNEARDKRAELIERMRRNQLKYGHTKKIYLY